jgi:hypothetical protein
VGRASPDNQADRGGIITQSAPPATTCERHLITKLFEAADGAALDALMVTLVKVVFTQVSIGLLTRKQVVSNVSSDLQEVERGSEE